MKVFITRKISDVAKKLLKANNIKVTSYKKDSPITKEELMKNGKNADGIISLLTDKIDKEIIDSFKKCKVIANYAVGYNNIDVGYAKNKGIIVTNTPDILTNATADIAMTLILSCARRFYEGEKMVRENKFAGWAPKLLLGIELKNKTIGIIGAGRIGTETAKRASAFGMKVIYYSKSRKENFEKEIGAKKVSLNQLLKKADVISLHLPLTDKTHHLLNEKNMGFIKEQAILVNTARGEIVDEKHLIKMLKQKKLFAAGFDVYENEPKINKELFKLKNVVLLPHLGSATFETRDEMAELSALNIINVLNNKPPKTPVN